MKGKKFRSGYQRKLNLYKTEEELNLLLIQGIG